jgi:hypothetical protein
VAVSLPAHAETPDCGSACVELYGGLPDITLGHPSFLIDSYKQGEAAGTPVVQFPISNTDPAEDFTVDLQTLVSALTGSVAVSASADQAYGDDAAYEIEYSPYGAVLLRRERAARGRDRAHRAGLPGPDRVHHHDQLQFLRSPATAAQLIAAAKQIEAVLGCAPRPFF